MAHRTRTRSEGPLRPPWRQRRGQSAFTPARAPAGGPAAADTPQVPNCSSGECRRAGKGERADLVLGLDARLDPRPRGRSGAGLVGAAGWRDRVGGACVSAVDRALKRACQEGSQTCIGDALTLTSGGGGVSC